MPVPAPLVVLYEDNHLLVVDKPAGLPTMGVTPDRPSLLAVAREYIKHRYQKPGNVYLGTVSRLDTPVSGIVVFARTSKAASRLSEQFRDREVEKRYWALVAGNAPDEATCVNWLVKEERHRGTRLASPGTPGAQEARLSLRTLHRLRHASLVEVLLETGRKHQIRVQLAARGFPILGDRKYGSQRPFANGIGLHARRVGLVHPTLGTRLELVCPLPPSWDEFDLSGED
ncbi:MAG TPA: RluA family pseudouridine synthase [Pirellulales bacterium]|jgi:23S rRNA pseudouridine1911/1915/1917 synthase|nr:RluA family pseudouridine synthase [Pirellulales bacterium]